MHMRIYQIKSTPILEDAYLTESDYYEDRFLREVADSVNDNLDRVYELERLSELMQRKLNAEFDIQNACFKITRAAKKGYFKNAYERFKKAQEDIPSISFTDFIDDNGVSKLLRTLNDSFCEQFEDYVSEDGEETIPFDEFVRDIKPGKRYYVGAILDYHY